MLKCVTCSSTLKGKQTKFCSIKCKQTNINVRHQRYDHQFKRGQETKNKLLEYKGLKCVKCGYSKNTAALCFHHLRDKSFTLDIRKCANSNYDRLKEEADKCIVLCHNCHMEEHHPEHTIKNC